MRQKAARLISGLAAGRTSVPHFRIRTCQTRDGTCTCRRRVQAHVMGPRRDTESHDSPGRTSPVGEYWLPGKLDLKLSAVILDLEFHFQVDLIGDVRDEP